MFEKTKVDIRTNNFCLFFAQLEVMKKSTELVQINSGVSY